MGDWAPDDLWQQERDMWDVPPDEDPDKDAALLEVTGAAIALKAAERERFKSLRVAAERRRDAIAAGATVAEIQAAIRAGYEAGARTQPPVEG